MLVVWLIGRTVLHVVTYDREAGGAGGALKRGQTLSISPDCPLLGHDAFDLLLNCLNMIEVEESTQREGEKPQSSNNARINQLIVIKIVVFVRQNISLDQLEHKDTHRVDRLIHRKRIRTVRKFKTDNLQRVRRHTAIEYSPHEAVEVAHEVELLADDAREGAPHRQEQHGDVDEAGLARAQYIDQLAHSGTADCFADTEEDHGVEALSQVLSLLSWRLVRIEQLLMPRHHGHEHT